MTELAAGHVIAGRYRLVHRLGEGGMGAVWSAEHLELRSRVAVKLIVPRHASDPDMLSRFVREARAAAALRSPHVVQILDSGIDAGLAFLVMEQLEGESLAARLAREGKLSPATTATVVTHVGRAMSRAHAASLVHRDLKPENIFLVQNEDELVAKVLDFGVAKVLADDDGEPPSTRTETGRLVGSPHYMSPEQARGRAVDFRSDLWAIGVVGYECLLGQRPFRGAALGEIILAICSDPLPVPSAHGDVPAGFDDWFARATARAPEERFPSARELVTALRGSLVPDAAAVSDSSGSAALTPHLALTGSITGEPMSSEAGRTRPPTRRYWPILAVAGAAAAIGAFALRPLPAPPVVSRPMAEPPVAAAAALVAVPPAITSLPAGPSAAPSTSTAVRLLKVPKPAAPRAVKSAAPSATVKVVKDPLSTRF